MRVIKLFSLFSVIFILSGCSFLFGDDDDDDDDINFYTVNEVLSMEFKMSFYSDEYIAFDEDGDCRLIIEDFSLYTYFDGEYYIYVYPYQDGYVGIDSEIDQNACVALNTYPLFIMEEDYTTGYTRVSSTNIYTKELDNETIELLLNDEGYVISIMVFAFNRELLLTNIRNINDIEIVIPEHIVYTNLEFIFLHYPDLVYSIEEDVFTTSSNGWMANIDFSRWNSITFTNSIDGYTYHFYDKLFTLNGEVEYSVEEFLELNETFEEEFFNMVVDIYKKEISIEEYFDFPNAD
ncbi:MAG: hypothetical protein QM489_02955 [Candidatus Izemoplasma sp.]